jgi:hypothetical protein
VFAVGGLISVALLVAFIGLVSDRELQPNDQAERKAS